MGQRRRLSRATRRYQDLAEAQTKFEDQIRVLISEQAGLAGRVSALQNYAKLLENENQRLKTQVAKTEGAGWFDGDLTFRLPAGRYVCVDFEAKRASVFSVPENCTDLLLGAGMLGYKYMRIGPPDDQQPHIAIGNHVKPESP